MMTKLNRLIITIIYFGVCSFMLFACAAVRTEPVIKTTAQSAPTVDINHNSKTPAMPIAEGKLLKLSEQPLEIRLFFAPDYNLIEDEKTGQYPDDSPKWAQYIATEVRDIDLNHDGLPERMIIFLTDPFGREINSKTYDIYFFELEAKKWKALNQKPFYDVDKLQFIKSPQDGDFDEIRYPDTRAVLEQAKETKIEILSINRFEKGEYREVECREPKTEKILLDCPAAKIAVK